MDNIIKIASTNPNHNIRLYLISSKKHYFLNSGTVKSGFDKNLKVTKSRESVLDGFSKMAFLFYEIIRLRIVGYTNNSVSNELLYILNLIPVNRKIRTFLDWKIFDPDYTRQMSRLFEVRNDAVHCISLNEIFYNSKNPVSLSTQKGFSKFKSDMEKAWKTPQNLFRRAIQNKFKTFIRRFG